MFKAAIMKLSLKTAIVFIAIIRSAYSLSTTGTSIRELTSSSEANDDYSGMESLNQLLHFGALNQRKEYLVKNLATNEYVAYTSEDELPSDMHQLRIWQKFSSM